MIKRNKRRKGDDVMMMYADVICNDDIMVMINILALMDGMNPVTKLQNHFHNILKLFFNRSAAASSWIQPECIFSFLYPQHHTYFHLIAY